MQRASLPEHGLRIALATLASLAIAPAAGANDGLALPADPTAMAAALVQPVTTDLTVLDPAAVVATVAETLPVPPPQAVPAAAAEPTPALEPQPTPIGTPPPPQPADLEPAPEPVAPDPTPEKLAPPPAPQPAAVEEPQYQPEPQQYQPPEPSPAPEAAPVTVDPPADEWSSEWVWNCGEGSVPVLLPAVPGAGMTTNANSNGNGNCGAPALLVANSAPQSGTQYHNLITRYHPLSVSASIHIGSLGADGPVVETNVVAAVGTEPLVGAAERLATPATDALAPLISPESAPAPDPGAAPDPDADPAQPTPNRRTPFPAAAAAAPAPTISSHWTPRQATPRQIQPKPKVHRSRSSHRRPTRHPLPPLRGPVIPVSSSGAAPLGGADGGGFHLTLLLAPFALALVDSARRLVRDATPPVVRERDKRRKRPG